MRFVMSYSCGKDSALALHRMVAAGHTPVALLVMVNEDLGRSWFHGVDPALLAAISDALEIPLLPVPSSGEAYHTCFEAALARAKEMGATCCVFGDIDIADNAAWCQARCEAAGIAAAFPLWQEGREALTREGIALGYQALIKCVRNSDLPASLLGRTLDEEVLAILRSHGVDLCGENGEYHTLVVDGPLFHHPVRVAAGEILDFGTISAINLTLQEE